MPSPFDITAASNTVTLDNNREGIAAFTVHNNTRRRLHATARLTVNPPAGAKWLTIQPNESGATDVRDFPIDGTQNFQVKITAPPDATPASYTLKLSVADEVNPDDNFTDSPDVVFNVREAPKPAPRPFPWWIVAAVVAVLVVIVAIVLIAKNASDRQADADATATQIALDNARGTVDAAAAAAAAAQAALNVFLGDWVPVDTINNNRISALSIVMSDTVAGNLDFVYKTQCPPDQNFCLIGTSRSIRLPGVPFTPPPLGGGTGNTIILVQPTNNSQLAVTIQISGELAVKAFRRKTIRENIDFGQVFQMAQSSVSQLQLNEVQRQVPAFNNP